MACSEHDVIKQKNQPLKEYAFSYCSEHDNYYTVFCVYCEGILKITSERDNYEPEKP